MVLIASIQCHHGDTGGGVPGGYNITASDIWGEGVRWPVVKVIDRGVERRDVLYALQANNRIPTYIGDLRAQIGSAQLGAQAPRRHHRPLRRGDRRRERRLHDRLRGPALPRGSAAVARRRLRSRRLRRPRPARQPRRAPAREGHRRGRHAHDRLHRLRHAARAPGVVDLRQHARLHGRSDRGDDGSRDPEERRLLRADQARRAEGLRAQPRPGQAGERGHAPPRCRRRRSHRGRDAARAARARGAADVQDRHPDDHHRRRPAHRRVVHRPLGRGVRGLVQRVEGHGRVGRAQRVVRQPLEGDRRDQRVAVPARAVEPRLPHRLRRRRASGAASAAVTTRRKCASTRRSTRTSSA